MEIIKTVILALVGYWILGKAGSGARDIGEMNKPLAALAIFVFIVAFWPTGT